MTKTREHFAKGIVGSGCDPRWWDRQQTYRPPHIDVDAGGLEHVPTGDTARALSQVDLITVTSRLPFLLHAEMRHADREGPQSTFGYKPKGAPSLIVMRRTLMQTFPSKYNLKKNSKNLRNTDWIIQSLRPAVIRTCFCRLQSIIVSLNMIIIIVPMTMFSYSRELSFLSVGLFLFCHLNYFKFFIFYFYF